MCGYGRDWPLRGVGRDSRSVDRGAGVVIRRSGRVVRGSWFVTGEL